MGGALVATPLCCFSDMRNQKFSVILFIILLNMNCSKSDSRRIIHYENDSLSISISLDTTLSNLIMTNEMIKIFGYVKVSNNSGREISFSNKNLKLVIDDTLHSRTYKNTIASETIDFSFITIPSKSTFSEESYWIINELNISKRKLSIYYKLKIE